MSYLNPGLLWKMMQVSVGTMPHEKVMRSIELLGTVVAPAVRKALQEATT